MTVRALSLIIACSCLISHLHSEEAKPAEVTFHEHVAPVVYANCTSCHRPGEAAPFAFLTYEDVSRKARTILRVVEDGYMPPWHAAAGHLPFLDERRLSDGERDVVRAWVAADKPEGDPALNPGIPEFIDGWQLGEPDLVVSMKAGYQVPADGPDIYRNFVIPLELAEDKWVKAVELRPSARGVVHHSLFFLDDTGTARSLDGADGAPGFSGMGFRRSGSLGGYVPGSTPRKWPKDYALPLPKGSDLILSTHFHPSGKAEVETTQVGLFFADAPPSKKLHHVQVPPAFGRMAGIDVPAGESDFKIEDTFELKSDALAIKVSAHAHYICDSMKMTATYPSGQDQVLLEIPDWDLDWQDDYYFAEEVLLPAGTVLKTEIWYDNSADNLDNPYNPPRRIKWGRESTDEMGSITLTVVAANAEEEADLQRSSRAAQRRALTQAIGGANRQTIVERLRGHIAQLDRNQDQILQELELPQRLRGHLLATWDADNDRALSRAELQALADSFGSNDSESPETP